MIRQIVRELQLLVVNQILTVVIKRWQNSSQAGELVFNSSFNSMLF